MSVDKDKASRAADIARDGRWRAERLAASSELSSLWDLVRQWHDS
jgi:hypothetical protein